ncbi:MAG: phenylalanine--tRNA ligase subunit beta [Patescibacteria group bacterium]|nr:phenylalanine--tRNA ligase subunit beta [Patescibacteria group bacterium]
MKISYNWIQEYLDFPLPPVADLVQTIGAQLGAVEDVIDLESVYKDVVIVKIVSCQPVADSDHLQVCLIDDGGAATAVERNEHGLVQVVCGAPNAREGLTVAWLPPGATVPSSVGKDPFVLGSRQLRGVMSNGMLASPQELAIGDSHDGILELDEQAPGTSFAVAYGLNDQIIDIENKMFTHRPDCFGILGVAREIAGILGHKFNEPDWFQTYHKQLDSPATSLPLTVRSDAPEAVPRFMAVALSGITIKPSSLQLQTYLSRVGIRPINNIVDATNYFMFLTGQPLHAYDYDKVAALSDADGAVLVARLAAPGEELTLLSGKTVTPRDGAVVIATDRQAIGLGGVMGGANTEVDANTKNIILECATFEMYGIRRTSMTHGLFSEAVTRFNKGQSPLQNDRVLLAAAQHICQHDGAMVASVVFDAVAPGLVIDRPTTNSVQLSLGFINARLGHSFTPDAVVSLLSNVGFIVQATADNTTELQIAVPFWRTDIALKEDIVEEVGRLYGFDKLPLELAVRHLSPAAKNPLLEFKTAIRTALLRSGANEVLTYSFVHGNLLAKVGQDERHAYRIKNALSPDLQYYRLSLTPSLLEKVNSNIRAGYNQFALFELGKTHSLGGPDSLTAEGVPVEDEKLALVVTADAKAAKQYEGAAYYQARTFLATLLTELQCNQAISLRPLADEPELNVYTSSYYAPGRAAAVYVAEAFVGAIGEYNEATRKSLKLPAFSAGFELDVVALQAVQATGSSYKPLPKYPKLEQDICLRVPTQVTHGQVMHVAYNSLAAFEDKHIAASVTPIDIFQRPEEPDFKQITIRISLASHDRTLTEAEVSKFMTDLADQAHQALQAERV